MRKQLLGLVVTAMLGTAWAQSPPAAPSAANAVVPAGNTVALAATAIAPATAGRAAPCIDCPKLKTICVAEPAKVVKTKVLFSSDCETKCHKALFGKRGDCGSCPDGSCGRAYVERYLYKRVEKNECDSFKCVPVQVPACDNGRCGTQCASGKCNAITTVVVNQRTPEAPAIPGVPVRASLSISDIPPTTVQPASAPLPRR